MPYDNPKQPVAIMLAIKRRKGAAAAKAFVHKHKRDFKPYRSRKARHAA